MPSTGLVEVTLFHFEDITIDTLRREIFRNGQSIHLTSTPYKALLFLVQNPSRVVSKDELLKTVWGEQREGNTVEQAIRQIRRALGDDKEQPRFIRTVPGEGYCFIAKLHPVKASEDRGVDSENPQESNSSGDNTTRISLPSSHRRAIWITTSFALLLLAAYSIRSVAIPGKAQFISIAQVTNDGTEKMGLVTDGKTIYFGESKGNNFVLASVSTDGGAVRVIPTPFVRVMPADISHDGATLLILAWEGIDDERGLWMISTSGGQPHKLGQIRCHSAAWSPDRHAIAFAFRNAIYITNDEGATSYQLQAFDQVPEFLRWSSDGKKLRFDLRNKDNISFTYWEIEFDPRTNRAESLSSLNVRLKNSAAWPMTTDSKGRFFIRGGDFGEERIFAIDEIDLPWRTSFRLTAMNSIVQEPGDLSLDPTSPRLFVIGKSAGPKRGVRGEISDLLRFDPSTHEFTTLLNGTSGKDVDFSRDGKWITYIQATDYSLWVSRVDGTAVRKIDVPTTRIELPRWSPDGRSIAYMAQESDNPWRIFIVPAEGGTPRVASLGTDDQGAPTWSPDGRWLVYGNVECQKTDKCQIRKIELSSGEEVVVPGSNGLGTARWSPSGQYIAALAPERHEVMLFDCENQTWRRIASGVNGNDLSWSADSRYVYASRPMGDRPEILRIAVRNGEAETAVDLSSFAGLSGFINTWFALAPDGSFVLRRSFSSNEIYSLAYSDR